VRSKFLLHKRGQTPTSSSIILKRPLPDPIELKGNINRLLSNDQCKPFQNGVVAFDFEMKNHMRQLGRIEFDPVQNMTHTRILPVYSGVYHTVTGDKESIGQYQWCKSAAKVAVTFSCGHAIFFSYYCKTTQTELINQMKVVSFPIEALAVGVSMRSVCRKADNRVTCCLKRRSDSQQILVI
jgi:hypothetical protein